MQLWQYCLLVNARSLYMFRALPASIIKSTKNCSSSHWCMSWVGMMYIQQGRPRSVGYCSRLPNLDVLARYTSSRPNTVKVASCWFFI